MRQTAHCASSRAGCSPTLASPQSATSTATTSRTTRCGWPARSPRRLSAKTHRQRLRTVRQFFERIIEWDWPDAPLRNLVIAGDIPKKPEPLPKFLVDRDAARLMAAAAARAASNCR